MVASPGTQSNHGSQFGEISDAPSTQDRNGGEGLKEDLIHP